VSADILSKIAKGRPVLIIGRIEQESWTDKTTGAARSKLVCVANEISQLDWDDEGAPAPATQHQAPQTATQQDDDIPF
jgi:single-stranded DNA-binding protein